MGVEERSERLEQEVEMMKIQYLCMKVSSSFFQDRVSLCNSPDCPRTHFVNQDSLELREICLFLLPECWD